MPSRNPLGQVKGGWEHTDSMIAFSERPLFTVIVLLLSLSDQYESLTEHISKIQRNETLQSEFKASILSAIPAASLQGVAAAASLNPQVKLRRLPDHCNVRPGESRLIQLIPFTRVNPDSVKPTGAAGPD